MCSNRRSFASWNRHQIERCFAHIVSSFPEAAQQKYRENRESKKSPCIVRLAPWNWHEGYYSSGSFSRKRHKDSLWIQGKSKEKAHSSLWFSCYCDTSTQRMVADTSIPKAKVTDVTFKCFLSHCLTYMHLLPSDTKLSLMKAAARLWKTPQDTPVFMSQHEREVNNIKAGGFAVVAGQGWHGDLLDVCRLYQDRENI